MSFTWLRPTAQGGPLLTKKQVAAGVQKVSLARGLDTFATVLTCMAIDVEAGANDDQGERQWWCPANPADQDSFAYPHDSTSDDGLSVGYLQQQKSVTGALWWGTTQSEMTLETAANNFLDRLADNYGDARNDPHMAGQFIQAVQGSGFPDRYQDHWDLAWSVVNDFLDDPVTPVVVQPAPVLAPTPVDEPDFKEVNLIGVSAISSNAQARGGRTIDLLCAHTTEGSGGMDLVNYMIGAQVSYHYLIDNDLDGNTVFDLVDTDLASWSVGNANNQSINYVIGRSTVEWTREEWLTNARKAIRIMAWLMIQDAIKYNVGGGRTVQLLLPNPDGSYSPAQPPGITDHRFVSKYIWGNHSDVDGDGPYGPPYVHFPWDVLAQDIEDLDGLEPGPGIGDDTLSDPVVLQKIDDIWRETTQQKSPSRSFMALDGNLVDTPLGIDWNTDGNVWTLTITEAYWNDVPLAVKTVEDIATNGVYQTSWVATGDGGSQDGFLQWLREFGQSYCQGLVRRKKQYDAVVAAVLGPQGALTESPAVTK